MDLSEELIQQARSTFFKLEEGINQTILKVHALKVENRQLEEEKHRVLAEIQLYRDSPAGRPFHVEVVKQQLRALRDQCNRNQQKLVELESKAEGKIEYHLQKMIKQNQELGRLGDDQHQKEAKTEVSQKKDRIQKYRRAISDARVESSLLEDVQQEQIDYVTTLAVMSSQLDAEIKDFEEKIKVLKEEKSGI